MANWDVYDLNKTKVGSMTREEVDDTLFTGSSSIDGVTYFFYDEYDDGVDIYDTLISQSRSFVDTRVIKENLETSGSL